MLKIIVSLFCFSDVDTAQKHSALDSRSIMSHMGNKSKDIYRGTYIGRGRLQGVEEALPELNSE